MKYKKPRIYRIFPSKLSEAHCAAGEGTVSVACRSGPEASSGCKTGAAAGSNCLPGAVAGNSCSTGAGFK